MGRSQADEDRDGDPGQTKTVAGEDTGTETGTDVDARTGTETENSLALTD